MVSFNFIVSTSCPFTLCNATHGAASCLLHIFHALTCRSQRVGRQSKHLFRETFGRLPILICLLTATRRPRARYTSKTLQLPYDISLILIDISTGFNTFRKYSTEFFINLMYPNIIY